MKRLKKPETYDFDPLHLDNCKAIHSVAEDLRKVFFHNFLWSLDDMIKRENPLVYHFINAIFFNDSELGSEWKFWIFTPDVLRWVGQLWFFLYVLIFTSDRWRPWIVWNDDLCLLNHALRMFAYHALRIEGHSPSRMSRMINISWGSVI